MVAGICLTGLQKFHHEGGVVKQVAAAVRAEPGPLTPRLRRIFIAFAVISPAVLFRRDAARVFFGYPALAVAVDFIPVRAVPAAFLAAFFAAGVVALFVLLTIAHGMAVDDFYRRAAVFTPAATVLAASASDHNFTSRA